MKSSSKFLIGIVIGAVLLILTSIIIVLVKPEPTYQPDDTPGGVVHNYLLALQKEDYERAYSYLSKTLPGYPANLSEFTQSIENSSWYFRTGRDVTLAIDNEKIMGTQAVVTVRETLFYNRGLLESSTSIDTFEVDLEKVRDQWRIVDSPYYFMRCWKNKDGCFN
jgi:hypothetical protein